MGDEPLEAAALAVALVQSGQFPIEPVQVPHQMLHAAVQMVVEETPLQEGDGITIRMNQADLAQLAGTSRESVSRFLADLERAHVVRCGRGRVTVLDPAKLRNYIF